MQLIDQPIKHIKFGKGIVKECEDTIITIRFAIGDKKFIYPDAFAKFLTLQNTEIQRQILELIDIRETQKEAKKKAIQEMQERRFMLKNVKILPQSQAVFDMSNDKATDVFSVWTVSTGNYISGYSRGFPRVPDRLNPNSMCLLTVRDRGQPEADRRIIGAFMVEEEFLGCYCRDGMIQAHPYFRLQLPLDQQLLLWPYIVREPQKQRWGKVPFKYMSNYTAEKILFDLKNRFTDESEKSRAEKFYQYYCKMNHLHPRIEINST